MRGGSGKKSSSYRPYGNHFVRLFQKARRSVISIRTVKRTDPNTSRFSFLFPIEEEDTEVLGIGAGFIIHRNGMILTNEHVIRDAEELAVKLFNGKRYHGKVIWSDSSYDIALIQTNARKPFLPLPLGSSKKSKVGELVMSIGNPLGLEHSISTGVISGKNRALAFSNTDKAFDDIIQTDCAINPGSSGGPLMNLKGEVIGMNAFVAKDNHGLGFAIGIDGIRKKIAPYLKN